MSGLVHVSSFAARVLLEFGSPKLHTRTGQEIISSWICSTFLELGLLAWLNTYVPWTRTSKSAISLTWRNRFVEFLGHAGNTVMILPTVLWLETYTCVNSKESNQGWFYSNIIWSKTFECSILSNFPCSILDTLLTPVSVFHHFKCLSGNPHWHILGGVQQTCPSSQKLLEKCEWTLCPIGTNVGATFFGNMLTHNIPTFLRETLRIIGWLSQVEAS